MGLGVLEDKSGLENVPGTVLLDEKAAEESHTRPAHTKHLKHGTGKYSHIVLAPQPSDDPNDPLNFPKWRKEVIIAILTLGSMLNAGTNGPYLNASYQSIADTLGLPLTTVVLVSGYNLLAAGLIGPWVAAFASKFGKRPVFLASTLICIVGTAIGEAKIDYNHLLAARIVQGFATSAFESLIVASVGDLYFLHERGKRVAFINFILNACSGLASIICGQVFAGLGWLWLFHLFQIFLVIQFIAMFLFCPETTYIRETRPPTRAHPRMGRVHTNFSLKSLSDDKKRLSRAAAQISGWYEDDSSSEIDISAPVIIPKKKTFLQSLAIFSGVYSHDNIIKFLFGPFLALACPGACYAIMASGILTAWYVGSQIILAGIFAAPPYLFGPSEVGFLGFGPFAGGLIAAIVMGIINEPVVQWMVRKNGGVYEPEFRLVFMLPLMIFSSVGLALFGYFSSTGRSAVLCTVMQAIEVFGVLIGNIATNGYALDAFRAQSNEVFIMAMLVKNFLFFGLSYFANDWVAANGPGQMMYVFAVTAIAVCIAGLPIYIYGKRLRVWWSKHNLFQKFNMETKGAVAEMG